MQSGYVAIGSTVQARLKSPGIRLEIGLDVWLT